MMKFEATLLGYQTILG